MEGNATSETAARSPAASHADSIAQQSMRASAWARPATAAERLRLSSTKSLSEVAGSQSGDTVAVDLQDFVNELHAYVTSPLPSHHPSREDDVPDWLKDS